MWDLFRYRSLRVPTILALIKNLFLGFQAEATQLALKDYAANIYLNGTLMGVASIIGMVYCAFTLDTVHRRKAVIVGETISIVIAGGLIIWVPCLPDDHCSPTSQMVQSAGLFLYRAITSISFTFFFISQTEYFPTQIKFLALTFVNIPSRLSIVIVPPTQLLFEHLHASIIWSFLISSVVMLIGGYFFP